MIAVVVVDDHPAVRTGLVVLLRGEPGIVPVATAPSVEDALVAVRRSRPDVAIVDYDLADGDGLTLCHELKSGSQPPRVLIYSAFDQDDLAIAVRVARADGLLAKGAPSEELFGAIRSVALGRSSLPRVSPEEVALSAARLHHADLPIFGMLMEHTPWEEIAAVLGLSKKQLDGRVRGMLACLSIRGRHAA